MVVGGLEEGFACPSPTSGLRTVVEGLRFPMVGAGLESGCWMVWEMVEWRLVASVSELESGCIVAELALRVPKGGRMSVRGRRKGALPYATRL